MPDLASCLDLDTALFDDFSDVHDLGHIVQKKKTQGGNDWDHANELLTV